MSGPEPLSDRDSAILDFERTTWQHAGAKETAIREQFDMTAIRYFQTLNALLDNEAALAAHPLVVKRLRRLRAQRQRTRSARLLAADL
jgi:hypothetical protein